MSGAIGVRCANALAVRVAGVAVVARPAVLRRVVVHGAGLTLRHGPFVAAGASAAGVGVAGHTSGVTAAVRRGAGEVAAGVGIVSGRARVAVGAGKVAWARRAGRTGPLIAARAGAGTLDTADARCMVVAIDGACAEPAAGWVVCKSAGAGTAVRSTIEIGRARIAEAAVPRISAGASAANVGVP